MNPFHSKNILLRKQIRFLMFFIGLLISFHSGLLAENIIIYSTTHPNNSEETKKEGVLKFEASSFDKIIGVTVNGKEKKIETGGKINFDVPYNLNPGINRFVIEVETEDDIEQLVYFLKLNKKRTSGSIVIAFLNFEYVANPQKLTSDSDIEGDTKTALTFVPTYNFYIGKKYKVQLRSIILREKYSKEENLAEESELSQISSHLIYSGEKSGYSMGFTASNEGAGFKDLVTSEAEIETYGEFSTAFYYFLNSKNKFIGEFSYKVVDDKSIPSTDAYDADANVYSITLLDEISFEKSLKLILTLGHQITDAEGRYIDNGESIFEVKLKKKIGKTHWEGKIKFDKTDANELDPSIDLKKSSTLLTVQIRSIFRLTKQLFFVGKAKYASNTSNQDSSDYVNQTLAAGVIFKF